MNEALTWHFFTACTLGALLLGYLGAEWTYHRMLSKAEYRLGEYAQQIEELVAKNDAAASEIKRQMLRKYDLYKAVLELEAENSRLEALLQLVPEGK